MNSTPQFIIRLISGGLLLGCLLVVAACSPRQQGAPAPAQATSHASDDGHQHGPGESKTEAVASNHQEPTSEGHAGHDHASESTHRDDDGHNHKPGEDHDGHDNDAATTHSAQGAASADDHAGHDHAADEGHADEVSLTPEAIRQNGIRVESVLRQAVADHFTVPGRITYNAEHMAHIGSPVQGRVAELKVRLGDQVKQGDALLVIDSPALGEAQNTFLQKRTDVEVARSAQEVARQAAERARRLYEGRGIALGELQKREGEYKAAQGAVRSAESSSRAAGNTLKLFGFSTGDLEHLARSGEINPRYVVRAPVAGSIVQREVTLGEVVSPDRDALMVVADLSELWVLADVPEQRVQQVRPGDTAEVTIEALGGPSVKGKVTYIAPELNRETRTAQVRFTVEDHAFQIKPGMFARVQLRMTSTQEPTAELMVPESAVHVFEGGQAVFVALTEAPGKFAARSIKTGSISGNLVSVLEGLRAGDQVVVDGAFVIKAELAKGIMEGKTCSGH